jgi:hypothetical protein
MEDRKTSRLDPEEVEVWCLDCNAKLFNSSIYDHPTGRIGCPHPDKCEEEVEEDKYRRLRL